MKLATLPLSKRVKRGFWRDIKNQRISLEKLGNELGIQHLDDWYNISTRQIRQKANFIVEYYNGSLCTTLEALYPSHNWDPLKFLKVPQRYWHNKDNQRKHLEKLGNELGVKQLDDWYNISADAVKKRLAFVTNIYNGSFYDTLKNLYPQHNWNPNLLTVHNSHQCRGHWSDENNQRNALESVGRELGVKQLDDWYFVPSNLVTKKLSFIVSHYNASLSTALKHLYPQHSWDGFRFTKVPRGYWNDVNNRRTALEFVGNMHGVKKMDDWYNVAQSEIKDKLSFISNFYDKSLYKALVDLYPNFNWDPLRFSSAPRGYWTTENTKEYFKNQFMLWQKEYNIHQFRDWYNLPPQKLKMFQQASRSIFGGVTPMLKNWFTSKNWSSQVNSSAPEMELQNMMQKVANILVHHKIGDFSVDIYVPEWNLAIEYQGEQHYQECWRNGGLEIQVQRDKDKKDFLERHNISLVRINYNWNRSWNQLRATLQLERPDLSLPKELNGSRQEVPQIVSQRFGTNLIE